MEADLEEVEVHARSIQEEGITGGKEVQILARRIWEAHRNTGPGRNWVKPWLTMSKSSMCSFHCDGLECDGFEGNVV